MRHSSFHRQCSDCALGLLPKQAQPFSSLPTQHPRGGARAHLGSRAASRLGPGSWRRGAGLFPLGSHPLWPGVPAAPARSRPVSILELGGRGRGRPGREQGCGAVGKLRRRGKGVRTQGRSAAPQLHSFSCSGERGREREEARAGLGAVTLGPQLERSRAAGRPRGGPRVGGRRPGAQAPGSQILGLGPSFLKYPGIKPSYIKYLGLESQPLQTWVSVLYNLKYLGFRTLRAPVSGAHSPDVQISDSSLVLANIRGSDPTIGNPGFSNCRPRVGGGLDREVRSGCHPLPSRGGFPGPPLRKGES